MLRLKSPIPGVVQDTGDLKQAIAGLKLVPYYGTHVNSSHSFLKLLCDAYELSPSQGSCINDLKEFAFEGALDITKRSIPGLQMDEDSPGIETKIAFAEALKKVGITLLDIKRLTQKMFVNWKVTGNLYLDYQFVSVGGESRVFLDRIHPKKAMYLVPQTDDDPRTLVVANKFTQEYLSKKENFQLIRAFPDFTEEGQDRRTVFHMKNELDDSDWYGRPDSLQSLHWQLVEIFTASHCGKVSATDMTAKIILAMMGPDPNDDDGDEDDTPQKRAQKMAAELRPIATSEGTEDESKSLLVMEYPFNGEPPSDIKLEINRDYRWFDSTTEKASEYIFGSHRWPRQLNGMKDAKSAIGGQVLRDLFMIKNESVIKPFQEMMTSFWSEVFAVMAEHTGQQVLAEHTIKFPNTIEQLVESLGNTTDTGGSDPLLED